MYAAYIMRERTQIYLDQEQAERLGVLARSDGRTKSDLIHEAVDVYLAEADSEAARLRRFREALAYLAEHPVDIMTSEEYTRRKREEGRRREEKLRRWWGR